MRDHYRIVQPYVGETIRGSSLESSQLKRFKGNQILWDSTNDEEKYPSDVIDDVGSETSLEPFLQGENVIYPKDLLKVQKERFLKLGRRALPLGWATVYERAISEIHAFMHTN